LQERNDLVRGIRRIRGRKIKRRIRRSEIKIKIRARKEWKRK